MKLIFIVSKIVILFLCEYNFYLVFSMKFKIIKILNLRIVGTNDAQKLGYLEIRG
jgi:hypothetical protein